MSVSRFKVYGGKEFNGKTSATVTIDRVSNLVTVRPQHFHKTYQARLEDLAKSVIWMCIKAEMAEKKKAKKIKRKGMF